VKALLIAGTDTDAGKTVLISALAAYWLRYCQPRSLGLIKPLQTGSGDRELYARLFQLEQTAAELNPLHFPDPLAPPIAAQRAGRLIELDRAWQVFEQLRQRKDFVLVEGLGGLGSPVTHETTVADLAWDWHLPTVLVVPVKLGAIGQAVANVALARHCHVHLTGIVLSCPQACTPEQIADWAPADLVVSLTGIPVLGLIPHLNDPTDLEHLAQVASDLVLEQLLPLHLLHSVGPTSSPA
jgi:dethiobiotin synthetase